MGKCPILPIQGSQAGGVPERQMAGPNPQKGPTIQHVYTLLPRLEPDPIETGSSFADGERKDRAPQCHTALVLKTNCTAGAA